MFEYIKGIIFVILYFTFLYIFGCSLLKDKYIENAPLRFLVGYITYALLLALGGIPMQFFGVPWKMFAIYLVAVIIAVSLFSAYRIYKEKIKLFTTSITEFIRQYWFMFFLGIILVGISSICLDWYWLNNGLDDGYYLTRIASLPYDGNLLSISASTGLKMNNAFTNSYNFNIFDLEASVYVYTLKIIPTLFARCFLAYINYFLFQCVIYVLFSKIVRKLDFNINRFYYQFIGIVIIIFSFSYTWMLNNNIHHLTDSWQNTTAMYYGSSIVRNMGIPLLLIPLIGNDKIRVKDICIYGIISLVLLSKSTIALPFSIITFISYSLVFYLNKKEAIPFLFISVTLISISIILGGNVHIDSAFKNVLFSNFKSYLIILVILVLILMIFMKKKIINEILSIIIIINILVSISPINNIFYKVSIYDFVACRYMTGLFVFMILISFIGMYIFLYSNVLFRLNTNTISIINVCFILTISCFGATTHKNCNLIDTMKSAKIFMENPYFAPSSVIHLGKELEELSKKSNKQIVVMTNEGIGVSGQTYSLAVSLRQFSPSVVSISALERYNSNNDDRFENYNYNNQKVFDEIIMNPSLENIEKLIPILQKYPINCIITTGQSLDDKIEILGFKKYKQINFQNSYYIYIRK